jgi:CelD/BcsL family acetyltransferase involved in cellulose biosynthesis
LRRRLGAPGDFAVEPVPADALPMAFETLNRLHALRWGYPAFAGDRLRFHLDFAQTLAVSGELVMSSLRMGTRVVSMLYDVRRGARQYNLKMGFDPAAERGFSLGLIHFGYALEAAAGAGVATYDFLAGSGRRTDFKAHLAQLHEPLATVQLVRGPLLRSLYRWYDSARRMLDGKHN